MEYCAVLCFVSQLYPTLCDLMDCSLPVSSVHEDFPGKNTAVDFHALVQGIFPTQGSNPGLPNCRQILYQLSHQGRPDGSPWESYEAYELPCHHSPCKITGVGCQSLLQGTFLTQQLNRGFPHCRKILYYLSHLNVINSGLLRVP